MRFAAVVAALAATVAVTALDQAPAAEVLVERRGLGHSNNHNHARSHRRRVRKRGAGSCKSHKNKDAAAASWSAPVAPTTTWTPEAQAQNVQPTTTSTWTPEKAAVAAATTWSETPKAAAAAETPAANSGSTSGGNSGSSNALSANGVTGFQGMNSGIGSWFKTNSGQDSTNGRSWCQCNYQDHWMGFAPDVSVMLNNFGGVTNTAGEKYCGAEAIATNPNNGKSIKIYIVDGFDSKWVRTPGSIDLTTGAFAALAEATDDKNTVIQNLQWELTGNYNDALRFNKCTM